MSVTITYLNLTEGVGIFPPVSAEDILRLLPADYSADDIANADITPWSDVAANIVDEDFRVKDYDVDEFGTEDTTRIKAIVCFRTMYELYILNTLPVRGEEDDNAKMAAFYLQKYNNAFSNFIVTLPSGKTARFARSVEIYRGS